MTEHFNLVNNSTLFGNYNTGKVIDESRYMSMQKVPEQFAKTGKVVYNYNNQNNFDTQGDISNFTSRQMGNQYGS